MSEAGKVWAWIVGVLLVLGVGVFLGKLVLFPSHVANKAVDTAYGVTDKTLNADNALTNYEKFKDLYNGAKAQVMNIQNTKKSMADLKATYGVPTTWTKDVRDQQAFLQQNLDGYMMQYQSLVKEYNADSSKLNRNLFKDKNLPAELPLDYTQLQ
ncbi:hypothetical protein PP175_29255 (plasmid) [Aneurinibacillus sp. Ricciae_BoGa-3]|uniref:hypothetical protein n=1 Tax=Aneurinibacillus sp. Ricciae_BoGa-3 TaxID=3022697 RepID=UPI002341E6E0|nr:hypothetical protein [Aneurinibacillus sp. Ricciae_BoGa-3]WCK57280.1 hypothetical protein PP175_29255 [Aneurinibacillus sp. Ricciae_BoGa-3]